MAPLTQIILGACLISLPFIVPQGTFGKILTLALPRQYQLNRAARFIASVFICVPLLTAGLYFVLNPLIPGSCEINIKAFEGGYTSHPLRPIYLQVAPIKKGGEPDFNRIKEGSFSLSGHFQKAITFDWFENKVLVKAIDVFLPDLVYFEKVISISPFVRAGVLPASYSLDLDFQLEENPFKVTNILIFALLFGIIVSLILFYMDGNKGGDKYVGNAYPERDGSFSLKTNENP